MGIGMELIDFRTTDGSRHFARLPNGATWDALGEHISLLFGAEIVNLVAGRREKAWMDFAYRGHRFSVSRHDGLLHFFVCDPLCPDVILFQVAAHCEKLLGGPG